MKKSLTVMAVAALLITTALNAATITPFSNVTSAKFNGTLNAVMYGDNPSCYPGTINVTIGVLDYVDGLGMMVDPLAENAIWQTVVGTLAPGALTFDFSVNTTMDGADVTVSVPGDPYEKDITSLFQQIVADGNSAGKAYAFCFIATGGTGKVNLNSTEGTVSYGNLPGIEVMDDAGTRTFKYKKTGTPATNALDRIQYTGHRAAHNQAYSDGFAVGGHSGAPSGSYVGLVEDRCAFFFHRGLATTLGWTGEDQWTDQVGTGVEKEAAGLNMSLQNMPNPFTGSTRITYSLNSSTPVMLGVYDVQGKLIQNLSSGVQKAGSYNVSWNSKSLPMGMYMLRLKAGDKTLNRKMIVLK